MIRTTVIPKGVDIHLIIPPEYVGKELEITYMPKEEIMEKKPVTKTMAKYLGILSDETAESMLKHVEEMRNEWDRGI